MSYDVRTGLGSAASGASIGSAIAPGIGTAIGAGIGLAGGFLGGEKEDDPLDDLVRKNRNLLSMLEARRERIASQDPTDSTTFQAQVSAAQEQAGRQADRDASSAAARGLTGSQFEIAQQGNRTRSVGRNVRRAAADASQVQRQREFQALRTMLQQRDRLNQLVSGQAQADRRARRQQNRTLFGTMSGLAQILSRPNSQNNSQKTDKAEGVFTGRAQRGLIT